MELITVQAIIPDFIITIVSVALGGVITLIISNITTSKAAINKLKLASLHAVQLSLESIQICIIELQDAISYRADFTELENNLSSTLMNFKILDRTFLRVELNPDLIISDIDIFLSYLNDIAEKEIDNDAFDFDELIEQIDSELENLKATICKYKHSIISERNRTLGLKCNIG